MKDLKETPDLKTNAPQGDKCQKYGENWEILFKTNKCLMCTVDSVISIILIAPLVVGFWRSTWMLMDFHDYLFPHYESLLFSVIIHLCLMLAREFLKDYVDGNRRVKKQLRFVLFRRMHTYVYSAVCVMQWRGVWKTFDQLFHIVPGGQVPDVWEWIAVVLVSSMFLLAVMKSLRNTVATPFVIALDTSDAAFNFPTRFRISVALFRSTATLIIAYSVPVYASLIISTALLLFCFRLPGKLLDDWIVRRKLKERAWFPVLKCLHYYSRHWVECAQWVALLYSAGDVQRDFDETSRHLLFIVALLLAIWTKTLRNTIYVPCDAVLKDFDVYIGFTSKDKMAEKTSLYVLDCIFSVLIVGTLVVFVWRGAWVLLDIFLFPESEVWSAWSSLILGYTAVGLAFLMQPAMRWVCDRLQGALRLFAADMFLIFSLLGTVNVWRGIWMLLNLYFLPDNLELSCWITHWLCLILLVLLGCSNSLLVRGVYIDAEEPAGKCVVFPCYYLRLIFQQERAKKIAKRLQLDVMSKRKQEMDGGEINHVTTNNQLAEKEANNHVV